MSHEGIELAFKRLKNAEQAVLDYAKGGVRDQQRIRQLEQNLKDEWKDLDKAIATL